MLNPFNNGDVMTKDWVRSVLEEFKLATFKAFVSFIRSSKEMNDDEKELVVRKVEEFNNRRL